MPLGIRLTDATPQPGAKPQTGEAPIAGAEAIRRAKRSGKEVEVTAERRPNATTWARPDGKLRTQIFSSTIRAKVGNEWKPIDTTLQRVEGGFSPKAVNGRLVFSAGSKPSSSSASGAQRASRSVTRVSLTVDTLAPAWTDLVRLTLDGHEMTVGWPGPLPEPVIDGPRALYENVRPGIDLLLTAQDGGYSHLLIVKDKKAAADPLLGELNQQLSSPDLTFRLDDASGAVSARDAKGEEIAGSPTPFMWDSSAKTGPLEDGGQKPVPGPSAAQHPSLALPGIFGAEGAHTSPAKAALSADSRLTITPDSTLLNDEDTVYPVFIDPSWKLHKHSWTLLYKPASTSSFFNGQNFNASGTPEARVGYETQSYGTARSVFNFYFDSILYGAVIQSATLKALETHSWSCTPSGFDVYNTPYINSSTTWENTNNASFWANRVSSASVAHGNEGKGCPDHEVAVDVKGAVQNGASQRWQAITFGLRAQNESDTNSWKKFLANSPDAAPYVDVIYNRAPDTPLQANMTTTPGGPCTTQAPFTRIGKTDITFEAKATDADGNLRQINFRAWSADGTQSVLNEFSNVNSDGLAKIENVRWDRFTSGKTYFWLAQAVDWDGWWSGSGPMDSGGGGWCTFTVDHTAPNPPAVQSAAFPLPGPDGAEWSVSPYGTHGTQGVDSSVQISANSTPVADIREYQWSLNHPVYNNVQTPQDAAGNATINVFPDNAGPNILYVRTVNKAGNLSTPVTYVFYVRPKAILDAPNDVTGDEREDVLAIDKDGNLRVYPADHIGDIDAWMPAATDQGKPAPAGYWKDATTGKSAIISHSTDWLPGDGLTDLIARMPDGKLYVYPGDGNGRFDISRRMEMLLPAGSPDPAGFTQLIATEDVTGDGMADFFALADNGDTFWAFAGYTGASFTTAQQIGGTGWSQRDIVAVRDTNQDGTPDLVFRDNSMPSRGLALRKGKPGANGGVDLASLASAAASNGGADLTYGTTGWTRTEWPLVRGTTDVSGDGVPDFYLTHNDGAIWLFQGTPGATPPALTLSNGWRVEEEDWNTSTAIG
ncbi:FG-GAP-like repeat-containing protein [Streptomyces bambusae]|uniref:DNRLRE domain-containing protein n=1 Tax=Streptomyces bambusae TaxID=1550616 RepID=A0ABS6Z2F6_9ACTN|nr:FG-GAP-like repeat-containing protein [Streptomyces bambusae]MBW5481917.1 DNRLRE domain-containing protein [Streptomyces bambusae]